jgi:hypothetical protein
MMNYNPMMMGMKPYGYQGGGIIGGLSRFLPGTGAVMAPRSSGPRDMHGRQQTSAGYQNKILGVPVGGAYYPRGVRGQYSEQENRRYYEKTGSYFTPTNFGPGRQGLHGLYTPSQRTSPTGSGSTTNQNLNKAIKNARDVTNLPGGSGYRPLVERAADTSIRMQQRYDTLRDVMRQSGMSGANESMNLRGQPIQKKQGGGKIKENSGVKNPHSTADRRALPIFGGGIAAVNPGEVVLSNRTVFELGGPDVVNRLNLLDKNSEISKRGGYNKLNLSPIARKTNIPPPSSSRGKISSITLPPTKSSSKNMPPIKNSAGSKVPPFSTVPSVAMSVRVNNADIYGIVG